MNYFSLSDHDLVQQYRQEEQSGVSPELTNEIVRRFVGVIETKEQYEAIHDGVECWYWGGDSEDPEHGTISGVYRKDGKVQSFGIDFDGEDFDEFSADALGFSVFLSEEALFSAMSGRKRPIVQVDGDILSPNTEGKSVLVCHQVNCQGVMGSGIAKQVKEECPEAFEAYVKHVKYTNRECLGDVITAYIPSKNFTVANIYGQLDYGRDGRMYTSYGALKAAFSWIRDSVDTDTVIRIPYLMGCYRGGGNWNLVLEMIKDTLSDFNVEIWKLDKG